ncbi:HIT family protein [Candidatus Saccharibacteria bacterium CPR2]|nr:HIT family protein [Candidatus Saccharibacteria bacterium CPR2]
MSDTIFDKIVRGEMDSYKVWEDDKHLAFLTPFPNTPGFTVLIPKTNIGDYIFTLDDKAYSDLMLAAKNVARILEEALGVPRVALVFEGTGVAYVHAKLIPLHGELAAKTDVWSDHTEFTEEYKGYITTAEGPQMSAEQLKAIQAKIFEAGK